MSGAVFFAEAATREYQSLERPKARLTLGDFCSWSPCPTEHLTLDGLRFEINEGLNTRTGTKYRLGAESQRSKYTGLKNRDKVSVMKYGRR